MTCPVCGSDTTVVDTRSPEPDVVKRHRSCVDCGYRFNTVEVEENKPEKEALLERKIRVVAGPLARKLRDLADQLQELEETKR